MRAVCVCVLGNNLIFNSTETEAVAVVVLVAVAVAIACDQRL